eukprot:CAMPEP_0178415836 /NCGR_PEP_ID=MMETSP0689_2-20121128/23755_1 /TAXON_ID=160604 /ORGANISM="Amphidinium massartii, Strain CS-259" /LENGTH=338 /DNA_ID=CAMNT_0020037165 /DNA_START=366 /DNA_END=1379 /DNA_ORIENTATION=-
MACDMCWLQFMCATCLPCAKDAVPDPANGSESVVAGLMALVVPIVMVRHLCEWQAALKRVSKVEVAAHTRVLLQGLQDAEDVREPEHTSVQRNQDLGKAMANDCVSEVVEPMVLIGVTGQRMSRPVVVGVDAIPQHWHHMECSVRPIHCEGQEVVIAKEMQCALVPGKHDIRGGWVETRYGIVEADIQRKLTAKSHAIMLLDGLQLLFLPPTQILLVRQRVLPWRLNSVLWEAEEDRLAVGVVEPDHQGLRAQEGSQLLQRHRALHIHFFCWQESCSGSHRAERCDLQQGQTHIAAEQQGGEVLTEAQFLIGVRCAVRSTDGREVLRLLFGMAAHDIV